MEISTALASCLRDASQSRSFWYGINSNHGDCVLANLLGLTLIKTAELLRHLDLIRLKTVR